MYREGMDTRLKFIGEGLVDHTVTGKPALAPERLSHDINSEMSLSAGPVSGVAFMAVGFVFHPQAFRRESLCQLLGNGVVDAHGDGLAVMPLSGQ